MTQWRKRRDYLVPTSSRSSLTACNGTCAVAHSKPANPTELAFRVELPTNGPSGWDWLEYREPVKTRLQNGTDTLTSMRNRKTLEVRFRALRGLRRESLPL
jgi:hypothetical protein